MFKDAVVMGYETHVDVDNGGLQSPYLPHFYAEKPLAA